MSNVYEIRQFMGGISPYEDRGPVGSFKFGTSLDIRKKIDSLTCGQALVDIGNIYSTSSSQSPSFSLSPSSSISASVSNSTSPSSSLSRTHSTSSSQSPSSSPSPSSSLSPSTSISPSHSVSPSPSPSAGLHTTFSDLIRTFVESSDGHVYGFGNTGKVYKINTDLSVFQVYDAHEPITGAVEGYNAAGQTFLYFASRRNLHRKQLPGRSDWNDVDADSTLLYGDKWPKSNLTDADWHTMVNVAGDTLIANGSTIAMAAYDDSYTNEALDLIPGNIAKTMIERVGRLVTGTYRSSDPTSGINAAIDTEVPLAQVGSDGQIFFANFTDTVPVKRFPGGGKCNPGGVTNKVEQVNFFDWTQTALSWINKQTVGNIALFGIYGATAGYNGIYSYGRVDKDHPFVMNLDYPLEVDEIGALACIAGVTYASYRHGADFGVKVVDMTNKAQAVYEGLDFRAPVKRPDNITTWGTAEVYFNPLPSGTNIQFWYRIDKNGSFVQAKTLDGATSYLKTGGKKAVFSISQKGDIFEPRVVLTPSGNVTAEAHRIRVYFS